MDILLANDKEGFDLILSENGDLKLTNTQLDVYLNMIKVALFTQKNWHGESFFQEKLGSEMEQLLLLPVTEKNRLSVEKEMQNQLQFMVKEKFIKTIDVEVKIIDNKKYSLAILLDNQYFFLNDWLEVRE